MTLKILQMLSSPHLGGAEHVALSLAEAHRADGMNVSLLLLAEGRVAEAARAHGIPLHLASIETAKAEGKAAYRRTAADYLRDIVRREKPDLVHSHVPLTNLLCHRVLPALQIPWITTVHGSWKQFAYAPETVRKPYLRSYLLTRHALGDYLTTRSASQLVAVSDYVKRELLQIGIPGSRITVIHNGLPLSGMAVEKADGRAALGLSDDALVFGAMGHFAPVKGFDILIKAFGRLAGRYPQAVLLIAGGDVQGDVSLRHHLTELIHARGLDGRIQLVGMVDPRAGFFSALDIFVVSSRTEGFSLVLAEAMLHGKASIISSSGGSREVARPGLESMEFRSGEELDLAEKMEHLIQKPEQRESLGRAAWARASTLLTLHRCAGEYAALYRSICGERAKFRK